MPSQDPLSWPHPPVINLLAILLTCPVVLTNQTNRYNLASVHFSTGAHPVAGPGQHDWAAGQIRKLQFGNGPQNSLKDQGIHAVLE